LPVSTRSRKRTCAPCYAACVRTTRGIIPVEAVERHVADVLIQTVTEALDARAA